MARKAQQRIRRTVAVAASVGAHLLVALGFALAPREPTPPMRADLPDPVVLSLVEPPPPPPPPPPPAPEPEPPGPPEESEPAPAPPAPPAPKPARPALKVRPARPSPTVAPLIAAPAEALAPVPLATVGGAELAGARTAGLGSGGGAGAGGGGGASCDMVHRLQAALHRDPEVRAAVSRANVASDRAILVWNGDWLRSPGQDGKGLAGVRQAIVMEVAFAPEACRNDPVQGLVVLSVGGGRLALGRGAWRWTDLLGARGRS